MSSLSNVDPSLFVTTVGTTGAELFKVFAPLPHERGMTFDGEEYSNALASKVYLNFQSGYGLFTPTPGVVPGKLVWVGDEFESEDTGNILGFDDQIEWIDFRSTPD